MNRYILALLVMSNGVLQAVEQIELQHVAAQRHAKMKLLVGLISPDRDTKKMGELLKENLSFTGQFDVTVQQGTPFAAASDVKQWLKQGYPLVVYVQPTADKQGYEWRLYDTMDAHMIKGKKMVKRGGSARGYAHNLADELWLALTGVPGFFSTKVVYGKKMCRRGRNCKRYIFMRDASDIKGASEELLVSTPTISVAPRWNRDLASPLVLYSEYTKTNVRLIAVNMERKRKVISNFDGVNMQVAYSPDGKEVVYCLSRAPQKQMSAHTTSQLYYYGLDQKTGNPSFYRLTTNHGNNFSPCWGPANTIFYATDAAHNGLPNICWYDLKTNKISWITQDSYATSPSYNSVTNKLAYIKMVNKKMQLWVYDLGSGKHRQLTSDATDKDDCSWSPCGTQLAYSVEKAGKSRIGLFNVLTNEQCFLTPEQEDCSYPAWSPAYDQFPTMARAVSFKFS